MIKDFLGKVPAGMMVVPMLLSAIINTLFPDLFKIGGFTQAVFTTAGTAGIIGAQLVCMGAQLRFKELFAVVRRGGTLLVSKFLIGAVIGIAIGKIFGMEVSWA